MYGKLYVLKKKILSEREFVLDNLIAKFFTEKLCIEGKFICMYSKNENLLLKQNFVERYFYIYVYKFTKKNFIATFLCMEILWETFLYVKFVWKKCVKGNYYWETL